MSVLSVLLLLSACAPKDGGRKVDSLVSGAAMPAKLNVELPEGSRAAAYATSTGTVWILTDADGTRSVTLTSLTASTGSTKSYPLTAPAQQWIWGGVMPAEDGTLWLAFGNMLVHFDPTSGSETDIRVASPVLSGATAEVLPDSIVGAVLVGGTIWLCKVGSNQLERYSIADGSWLQAVVTPLWASGKTQLVAAGGYVGFDGVPEELGGASLEFVSVASSGALNVGASQTGILSLAGTRSGNLLEMMDDGSVRIGSSSASALGTPIPIDEIVSNRPWISDSEGLLWSWVRYQGDSIARFDPATGEWTAYQFPDVTLSSGDFRHRQIGNEPTTVVANPDIQTVTPTPDGVIVTTRAGTNPYTHWLYSSVYILKS